MMAGMICGILIGAVLGIGVMILVAYGREDDE